MSQAALPAAGEVRTIVAFMLGEIGDLLVATPALHALKQRYPGARLALIVRRQLADLVQANPDVDELLLYDSRSRWSKAAFLVRLRLRRWDLWVDLHTPTFNTWNSNDQLFRRNRWFMRAAHARFRRGFAMPPIERELTHPEPLPDVATLRSENIVATTLRLAGDPAASSKRLYLLPQANVWAKDFRYRHGLADTPVIGLFFGAKQSAKVWPLEHAASFVEALALRHAQYRLLLLGGPHEADYARALASRLPAAVVARLVDTTAQLSLAQTAALLSGCAAVVCTDSGPMHMAEALGRPLVALMSAHNYGPVWRPLHAIAVLRADVPCSPCLKADCSEQQACMRALTPDAALAALDAALAPTREAACA
jgi:ADP-heptose:LPS heptosyltransferase